MNSEAIILILGGIIFIWAMGAKLISSLKARRSWRKFAEQTGLAYEHTWLPGVTHLCGTYQGRQIEIETFCNDDKYNSSVTHIVLALNTAREIPAVMIRPYRNQIIKMHFGKKDGYRQDDDFYQRFLIKCQSKRFVSSLFTSLDLRQQLVNSFLPKIKRGLGDTPPEIHINSQWILFKQRACYALRSSDELKAIATLLITLADGIEDELACQSVSSLDKIDPI